VRRAPEGRPGGSACAVTAIPAPIQTLVDVFTTSLADVRFAVQLRRSSWWREDEPQRGRREAEPGSAPSPPRGEALPAFVVAPAYFTSIATG
jgi:hypothetical protein